MAFFRTLPSVNENYERESNPMLQSLYLYLSGSVFLVSPAYPNKKLFNVKSLFAFVNHGFSVLEVYRFIPF